MIRAIWVSIGAGAVVQLLALAILWVAGPSRMMIGWGVGALLRLIALLVYGWAVVPALGLPLTPALLTLVGVLFVTTLVEPLLLNDGRARHGPTI